MSCERYPRNCELRRPNIVSDAPADPPRLFTSVTLDSLELLFTYTPPTLESSTDLYRRTHAYLCSSSTHTVATVAWRGDAIPTTMRVNVSYVQRCKATAHVFQVVLTFIAGCLTLAVLTKQGDTGGATKFFFATVRCVQALGAEWTGLTSAAVLPYHPRHHLPRHGAHVLAC